jgi:hypothetical protein
MRMLREDIVTYMIVALEMGSSLLPSTQVNVDVGWMWDEENVVEDWYFSPPCSSPLAVVVVTVDIDIEIPAINSYPGDFLFRGHSFCAVA